MSRTSLLQSTYYITYSFTDEAVSQVSKKFAHPYPKISVHLDLFICLFVGLFQMEFKAMGFTYSHFECL